MIDVVIHRFGKMEDASPTQIAQVMQARASSTRQRIEKDTFTKRVIGNHDLVDANLCNSLLKDECTGQNDVGPTGIHPWKRSSFFHGTRGHERLHCVLDLFAGHHEVVHRSE